MSRTLDEKLDALSPENLSRYDLRMAAKVALICGDCALAAKLREIHDDRPQEKFVPRLVACN